MRFFVPVLIALGLLGCTKYVVRDTVVYQTELNQYDAWATKQAALLKGFVSAHCTCDAGKFTTPECAQSADFILTVEARASWHKDMSLFLAGIVEKRPSENPPEIPASSTLCPAAPATPVAPASEGAK
jgi:hypothetical protein